jgi:hypothetical protein
VPVESDTFVYLALQKTGSTFIHSVLGDLFGAQVVFAKHSRLLDEDHSKFVFGSIRNPWDMYVSLWSYGCQGEGGLRRRLTNRRLQVARRQLPEVGPLLREITKPTHRWRTYYSEPHSPEKFNRWLVDMHNPAHAAQIEPAFGATQMRGVAGYVTYRYCNLYTSDVRAVLGCATEPDLMTAVCANFIPQTMIRFEHLADDLIAATRAAGYVVDETLERQVRARAAKPVNDSDHKPYWEYYDDTSRELVRRRDAVIVERHGYVFGS